MLSIRPSLVLLFVVAELVVVLGQSPSTSTTPATTTKKPLCKSLEVCYEDKECGDGRCIGAFTGKCNCNACLSFWKCESDAACGGLVGACDQKTNTCKCIEAFEKNGYQEFTDALRNLCNVKACGGWNSTLACHGLPCHAGRCVC